MIQDIQTEPETANYCQHDIQKAQVDVTDAV